MRIVNVKEPELRRIDQSLHLCTGCSVGPGSLRGVCSRRCCLIETPQEAD